MPSSSDSNERTSADQAGGTGTSLTPAERLLELASDPYVRDTETLATLEFHSCAHENAATWWKLEKQTFLVYPSHPSENELAEALKNPAEIMDATPGEMAAAQYATAIIVAYVNLASFLIQGIELEAFIRECIGAHTDEACKLLRPASENQESRIRVAHLIDLYTTTALTSIRMISHIQAALKNGMEWDEVTRMVPQRSVLPDDDEIEAPPDADNAGVDAGVPPARHAGTDGSDHLSEAEVAAKRRSVVMPILERKRWSRGKWVTKAAVGKNCVYEYLKGKRNPGYENRQAMADALGLAVEDLPE